MGVEFTAHNIRLDDGSFTNPGMDHTIDMHPWFQQAKRIIEVLFPGDKSNIRLADLGCLEGGYSVEFARMGLNVLGLDVRESNLQACHHVQANTNLPNLDFVRDDVWNVHLYGKFDIIFCCGLLYHLDQPRKFLEMLAQTTNKLLIVQTHFALTDEMDELGSSSKFRLSDLTENESLKGRWFVEFASENDYKDREKYKWASWDNKKSFWVLKEHLLQTIHNVGFDLVLEQFDGLEPNIADSMMSGFHKLEARSTFIGIKNS